MTKKPEKKGKAGRGEHVVATKRPGLEDSLLELLAAVPAADRPERASEIVRDALISLSNLMMEASRYPSEEREIHLLGVNVCLGLASARIPRDQGPLRQMGLLAARILRAQASEHEPGDDMNNEVARPLPTKSSGTDDEDSTNRGKLRLLDVVDAALQDLVKDEQVEDGRRLEQRDFEKAIAERSRPERASALNEPTERAALLIQGLIVDAADVVAPILARTPAFDTGDRAKLAALIDLLLRRRMATAPAVAKVVAHVYGLPWTSRRNFLPEKIVQKWHAERASRGGRY